MYVYAYTKTRMLAIIVVEAIYIFKRSVYRAIMPATSKKQSASNVKAKSSKNKTKIIPTRLPQHLVEEVDAIAKAEQMTRAEVIRRSIEAFTFNYKTDQLDQRQLQLEKRMKAMETAMRSLLVKSIRLNGQVLYFSTLPWTQGLPKSKLSSKGFQVIYEKSAAFATQFLKSKAAGKLPEELELSTELLPGDVVPDEGE